MLKFLFFAPLIAGAWFMYKATHDDEAWRSVRLAWFLVGLVSFAGGVWMTFVAAAQLLVEVAKVDDPRSQSQYSEPVDAKPPSVINNFGTETPQGWGGETGGADKK